LKVTAGASGGGLALAVINGAAAENLTLDAKGTGTIGIGTVSTGNVNIGAATRQLQIANATGAVTIQAGGLAVSAGGAAITGAITSTTQIRSTTSTALSNVSASQVMNDALGQVFTLAIGATAAQTITCNASPPVGSVVYLIVTASATSDTLTFGANCKSTATLITGTSAAKVFVMMFVSDGTNLNEVSRTIAM
jgi:hypothetical protein